MSTEINDADFDKVLDAVLRAAKKVEQDDYDGNMPIKDYVAAVTIGLKSHRK
ncbi:nitrogen regulatory protein P-1 [Roseibium sp. TrichSKD4]|nr:nitrogen regulatory protein P-1 [Roseibium sp. TrichSKD4]